jgi:hypothetical protein
MSSHDEKYSGSCAGYAIGALDGKDLQEFEAHLKEGCASCGSELSILKEASALLPVTIPQLNPSPELKERIEFSARLSQIVRKDIDKTEEEQVEQPDEHPDIKPAVKAKHSAIVMGMLIAMIVMLIGFSVYIYSLFRTLEDQKNAGVGTQALLVKAVEELERKNIILDVFNSRDLKLIQLHGTEFNPDGYGQLIWDPAAQTAVLHVDNLPQAAGGKVYILWVSINRQYLFAQQCSLITEWGAQNYFQIKFAKNIDANDFEEIFATQEFNDKVSYPSEQRYLFYKKVK